MISQLIARRASAGVIAPTASTASAASSDVLQQVEHTRAGDDDEPERDQLDGAGAVAAQRRPAVDGRHEEEVVTVAPPATEVGIGEDEEEVARTEVHLSELLGEPLTGAVDGEHSRAVAGAEVDVLERRADERRVVADDDLEGLGRPRVGGLAHVVVLGGTVRWVTPRMGAIHRYRVLDALHVFRSGTPPQDFAQIDPAVEDYVAAKLRA